MEEYIIICELESPGTHKGQQSICPEEYGYLVCKNSYGSYIFSRDMEKAKCFLSRDEAEKVCLNLWKTKPIVSFDGIYGWQICIVCHPTTKGSDIDLAIYQ